MLAITASQLVLVSWILTLARIFNPGAGPVNDLYLRVAESSRDDKNVQIDGVQPGVSVQVYGEAPPWKHGPTVVLGSGTGFFAATFYESSVFEIDTGLSFPVSGAVNNGELEYSVSGVSAGTATQDLSFELLLGVADFEERNGTGTGTDDGLIAGGRVSWSPYQEGHLSCGADIALVGGLATIPGTSDGNFGSPIVDTTLRWMQADIRGAVSYVPSSRSLFSAAPMFGAGVRLIEGLQETRVADVEFDANRFYLMGGLSTNWRPSDDFQLGLETQVMIGQIEGISFSLNFSF